MFTVWMTYLLAAIAASAAFMTAGRRSRDTAGFASPPGGTAPQAGMPPHEAEIDLAATYSHADVGAAMRLALKRLAPVMLNQSVQAEIATPPGLFVRLRPTVLVDLLEELLTTAIHSAPASRLLLTAEPRGDRVYVGVTDDVPGADPAVRLASVRGLMQRVALCGAALDVDVRLQEGTSMTLRFAAATSDRQEKTDPQDRKDYSGVSLAHPAQSASMVIRG